MKTTAEKLRAFLERGGATSLMNNTKWKKTIGALLPLPLRFRVKLLMTEEVSDWTWLIYGHAPENYIEMGSWVGPVQFVKVEWLEIDTIERKPRGQLVEDELIEHTDSVEAILSSLRVPFSKEQTIVRIWGHFLPND